LTLVPHSFVTISVTPGQIGWIVTCDANDLLQVFRSGGEAERKARQMAAILARGGHAVRVVVHDVRGTVIGAKVFSADNLI
jgi:hypothetical protein